MEKVLVIEALKENFSMKGIKTLTVGELISILEDYEEDMEVYLSHKGGETYGGITKGNMWLEDYDDGWKNIKSPKGDKYL